MVGRNQILDIRLLGPPEVSFDGTPIEVDTRKAIALLAYLSVEHDASRDTLATLFWADSSSERARATLRRTLSSLRAGIGAEAIAADRNRVALTGQADIDIVGFDSEIQATFGHDHEPSDVCPRCLPHLTRATDLYRGDFLQGFSVRDAPEFEDWARTVGEEGRLRAGEAFHRLAMGRAGSGDYQGGIAAVNRWIELDTLHEPAHRLLMLLNAWAGDRPGAVEAYRAFVAILDTELGVTPLEETTELYEAILDEDLPPAPGARRRITAHQPPAVAANSDLLDRELEFGALRQSMELDEGTGRVVALTGTAWMGKTRLLEELTKEAEASGWEVLFGRAFRMEQTLPYGVITQILSAAAPLIDSARQVIPEWALAEVTRLIPELAPDRIEAPADRFGELRLLEGIYTVLAHIAKERRIVISVDDLQWVDPASAGILSYLARRLEGVPILMIVAARSAEPLAGAVGELVNRAGAQIVLEPLTPETIESMAPDGVSAESIISRTGGVPLLVIEALAETSSSTESPGVIRYMEMKMREISDLGRQVLGTASVLNGVCSASLIRETSGRSEDEVVEAVEELVRAGLLREVPDGDGLTFTLDALEKITYDSTSLIRRRLLHRRAAEALENRPRSRSDVRLAAAIAGQHRGAGDDQAASWYRRAGDLARGVYANSEAANFYEISIALGSADTAELHLALGEIAMASGDYGKATSELTTASAQALGSILGLIEHRLGTVQRLLGRFAVAEEHYERATVSHPQPGLLYADWALLRHRQGDHSGAAEMAKRGMESVDDSDDLQMSRVLNVLGIVTEDPAIAMTYLEDALSMAGDDELLRMAAMNNQAFLLAQIGNVDGAVRLVEEAIGLANRTGRRHQEAALLNHLADLHHRAGRTSDAEDALTNAVKLFADIGSGPWEPEVWLLSQW